MRVWVAETGMYSDRGVVGVYGSREAAQEAWPKCGAKGWIVDEDGSAWNGLDWDASCSIEPFEVIGAVVIPASETEPA